MADQRKPKPSPYTADRGIPGAFEGETVTRRRFMVGTANGAGVLAAAAFTLPALGFAVGPIFERPKVRWENVGSTADFDDTTYTPRVIREISGIGETGNTTVYMRKRGAIDSDKPDRYNQYIALSTRCMHLGCPVRYVDAASRFLCPCHGGVYDFQGNRVGGPPVRPLDRFFTRVRNGQVEVGPRYSVNSQLKRFSPRDPGQDTDGIGKYLYPPRFDTRPLPH
jgi:quinol---cytochrome c reductase iron-sulfur subunit, bacillus type